MLKELSNYQIQVDVPKYPGKITGTKLSAVLGCNPFNTPFQTWAELVKAYKKPFEENIYTKVGKIVEPKQAQFIKNKFKLQGFTTPADVFGKDFEKTTYGDFYKNLPIFGGKWDYLVKREDNTVGSVLEMKSTKIDNKLKWDKNIPVYYLLQAGLYAYLCKTDKFNIIATYLNPEEYEIPENIVVNEDNTFLYPFKLSTNLRGFEENYIMPAVDWYKKHVLTGISPCYDPNNTGDMKVLDEIKKSNSVNTFSLKDINADDYFV